MDIEFIAPQIAKKLKCECLLCYGSYAQKLNDKFSDIDLLALVNGPIPSPDARKAAYSQIPGLQILEIDKKISPEWDTSWSPVNDKLQLAGTVLEIGFNTTSWVECVIDNLIVKKKISFPECTFRPYTFLGLLESALVLYDRADSVKKWRATIRPIPSELKQAIISLFLPSLKENVNDLTDCVKRDIGILSFLFFLNRALDAAVSLLFIINETYDPATKRSEPLLLALKSKPAGTDRFLQEILPHCYEKRADLLSFLEDLVSFCDQRSF